jgi:hypothetical protein
VCSTVVIFSELLLEKFKSEVFVNWTTSYWVQVAEVGIFSRRHTSWLDDLRGLWSNWHWAQELLAWRGCGSASSSRSTCRPLTSSGFWKWKSEKLVWICTYKWSLSGWKRWANSLCGLFYHLNSKILVFIY